MLCQPNELAAFLYQQLAEQMPPMPEFDLEDEQGLRDYREWCRLDEEWLLQPETFTVDLDRASRFIERTETLLDEIVELELNEDEPVSAQYMTLFYDAAKDVFDHDRRMIRTYFQWLYTVIYHRPEGARWGQIVEIYGAESFREMATTRFGQLFGELN